MKIKQISLILTLLTLNLKVLSFPNPESELSINEIEQQNNNIINENVLGDNIKDIHKESSKVYEKERKKAEKQRQKEEKQRQKEEKQRQKEEKQNEKQRIKEEEQRQKEEKQRQKEEKQRQKEEKKKLKNNDEVIDEEDSDDDICLTQECIEYSKKLLSNMDLTVDPCDDFYQYACGGWMEQNEIPSNSYSISTSVLGDARNIGILKGILERDYKVNEKLSPEEQELDKNLFNKIKSIFNTCMDVDKINAKGKQPLMNLYDKLQIYENRSSYNTADGLTEQIVKLNKYGIFPFFKIGGHKDYEKDNNYLLAILQNGLTLSKDYYEYEKVLVELRKYIKNVLLLIFDSNERDIDAMADSILELEKKVANAYAPSIYLQNPQLYYNKRSIDELNESHPFVNWNLFFEKRLKLHNIEYEINSDTIFIDMTPDYLTALSDIIANADVDSIAYFLEWRVIDRYYENLSSDLQQPVREFSEFMFGGVTETPLYGKCMEMVNDMMEMALGKYYIEETFDYDIKSDAEEFFRNVKESMINRLTKMDWLDDETRAYATEKVKAIKENIAYPDYLIDLEYMTKKYELLEIDPDDYFNNYISYVNMYQRNDLSRIVKPSNEWLYSPQTFNGFYYPPGNSIYLLAGILQQPFYDSHEPDYINYGGIGMLLGHELTHAFDSTGRQFDITGKTANW
eukprot:jgi/Orpsp1_1/1191612/evm.model.d7180000087317.1